ncbi:MAG: gliding-motility protein MglA, partial [Candidatus Heimdallarchaeota archaeon]|nr:gliding-motility protein MglA [Candidatus Heimdallarchaeota archaeon]
HTDVTGIKKGGLNSIEDLSGRTIYFDFSPFMATSSVILDIYTVAGQRRHRHQRSLVLKGVDGLLFVADSSRAMLADNIESAEELKKELGDKIGGEIPIVIALNKRDAPDAMDKRELVDALNLGTNIPIYETIAVEGIGVKRCFQSLAREVLLLKVYAV